VRVEAAMHGRQVAGVILVAVGVSLLVIEMTGVGGVAILLLGGVAFLSAFVATRSYGFLVPGGILTGLGTALVLTDAGIVTVPPQLGIGAGFLLIPLLQLVLRAPREGGWWWPLIPGGILTTIGVAELFEGVPASLVLPGVLIVVGLAFVASGARGAGRRAAEREAALAGEGSAAPGTGPGDAAGPAEGSADPHHGDAR